MHALAECSRIDECQQWADKAEALASYAKQSKDENLRKMADRIQARAIRRCGELLKQIPPANGANQNIEGGDSPKVLTRKQAAIDAGLSDDQRKTALRVASVPENEFDSQVESDSPPTVTQLAEQGKKSLVDLGNIPPERCVSGVRDSVEESGVVSPPWQRKAYRAETSVYRRIVIPGNADPIAPRS
jgi:hypothetical protein